MAFPAKVRRSQTKLYLLGNSVIGITGSKLPSMHMALGFFLHHHLDLKKTVRKSSDIAITEITKVWKKARIPTRGHQNCQTKLQQTFEEWRLLKKNKARTSPTQLAKESAFVSRLDDLFDIAHADALNNTSVLQEDKNFLLAQREKRRRGSMVGVDVKLATKDKMASKREDQMVARRHRSEKLKQIAASTIELISCGSESEISSAECIANIETGQNKSEGSDGGIKFQTRRKRKRGRKNVVTPELSAALDRTKVSDRKAVFVIAETAKSLGQNIDALALNRDSIRRQRIEHRIQRSANIKAEFHSNVPLVVHWDGKMIPDLIGKEKVDRLPVLVSGKGVSQLLSVAKLPSGTGEAQAAAVFGAIEDWGLAGNIQAMCFDTTSSNTGRIAGACVLLEQKLEKSLLSLACRHHIMELIIGAVFQVCMGVKSYSSPEVPLFKRFREYWRFIDTTQYESGIAADDVAILVEDIKQSSIDYANKQLEHRHPRDDYKELLELVIVFLGIAPARGVRFMSPGAMHHARWMSKVIYSLKIWMFRGQFKLTPAEMRGLRDVCVFTVRVYLKAWISAPQSSEAPYNDLLLLKTLIEYSSINPAISKSTSRKFSNHLWYLSQELVSLAFFDSRVSSSTKRLMVSAMNKEEDGDMAHCKRISISLDSFKDRNLEDLVTARSMKLLQKLDLPDGFLAVDPDLWDERDDYKQALETVKSLKVVNDHAERGVALIQEYNGLITRDEMQLQFLLQVVEDHRRMFPDSRKQTLSMVP